MSNLLKVSMAEPGTGDDEGRERYRVYFVRFNNSDKGHNERSRILNKGLRIPCVFPTQIIDCLFLTERLLCLLATP